MITSQQTSTDVPAIGSSLKFAWDTMWQHFFSLLGVMVVVTGVPAGITFFMNEWIRAGVIQVYDSFLLGGMWSLMIHLAEGFKFQFSTLFSKPLYFWRFIALNIMVYAIVIVGLILLVVPGIMWAIQFGMAQQAMSNENLGPIAALKRSSQLTKGHRMKLFVWFLSCMGILMVASMLAGIIAAPFSLVSKTFDIDFKDAIRITVTLMMMPLMAFFYLAWAHVYTQLSGAMEEGRSPGSVASPEPTA